MYKLDIILCGLSGDTYFITNNSEKINDSMYVLPMASFGYITAYFYTDIFTI